MAGPWWMNPDNVLGFLAVKKPKQFDREDLILPPDLTEQVTSEIAKGSAVIDAYVRGVVSAVAERMERAAEAMITDPNGWGILAIESWDGLDFQVRVWLHPDVPYGQIHHHKVYSIDDYVAHDPVLSEGGGRLVE